MPRWLALGCALVAACGGKSAPSSSKTPSADMVVGDVDGGTVVGAAMPDPRKVNPPMDERRTLSHTECRAVLHHFIEIYARETNADPSTMQSALYDPNRQQLCETPVFSDEILDCLLAARTQADLPPCMKFGDPHFSP